MGLECTSTTRQHNILFMFKINNKNSGGMPRKGHKHIDDN